MATTDLKPVHKKYDARADTLVMERRTLWDTEIGELSEEDKTWLTEAVHKSPEQATHIAYFRSHTGFTREITVTVDDVTRLYNERFSK
ncbi:hypothetical protein MNBD_PLANCTO02-2822 [hydrothermal vent metagenome]|uniref:Uncharacterized protein n=1 Tax=hydrothermal vent metagenome TaxID=652676 RepID=A0A3B1E6D5_9ZZZZ